MWWCRGVPEKRIASQFWSHLHEILIKKTLHQYNFNYPTHSDFSILRVVLLAIEQPTPPSHLLLSEKTWNRKVELVRDIIWNNGSLSGIWKSWSLSARFIYKGPTEIDSVPCLLYENISENSDWVENLRIYIPKQKPTVNWMTSIQPSNKLGGF